MTYIRTIEPDEAAGLLSDLYARRVADGGSVPNHMKAMSLRPEAIQAWQSLVAVVRSHLDLRTYELVTTATASALRCTY